jgi:hypothetical protein
MSDHCTRCNAPLIGHEQRSDTCNRCLDLGYASMSDEEYDAQEEDAIDRVLRPSLSKTRLYALALFLALHAIPASAAPIDAPADLPAHCYEARMRVYEDHSAAIPCADGHILGYDPATDTWHESAPTISVGVDANGVTHYTRIYVPVTE